MNADLDHSGQDKAPVTAKQGVTAGETANTSAAPLARSGEPAGTPAPLAGGGEASSFTRSTITRSSEQDRPAKTGEPAGRPRFVGGKGGEGVWQRIISEMPPHSIYVEAFLGTGTILRKKAPALMGNVGVELDRDTAQSFQNGYWHAPGDNAAATVICADAVSYLSKRRFWPCCSLIYCDPPYLLESRSCQREYYACEFSTTEQHLRLLTVLKSLRCFVIISAYPSELYAHTLVDGWRCIEIPTVNRAGKRVTECLWCNFPPPKLLHDYRWLGRDFRERERIGRKIRRWANRLKRLPDLERAAIRAALDLPTPF